MGKSVHKCEFGIERAGCAVSGRGAAFWHQPSPTTTLPEAARPPQRAIRVMPISDSEKCRLTLSVSISSARNQLQQSGLLSE